jgi:uncharacterized membrane-anchored protein
MISGLCAFWRRIPRPALFAAVGVLQVLAIGWMVFDRVQILRNGREVQLQTRAVDPRDFLRGDYVTLSYEIATVDAGALKDTPSPSRHPFVFIRVAPRADGTFEAKEVSLAPIQVAAPEALLRGRISYGANCGTESRMFCASLNVGYGIDRYFVPQGEGLAIEKARDQRKLIVVAAVLPDGRAAIKRLLIDGKPVYDEPLF